MHPIFRPAISLVSALLVAAAVSAQSVDHPLSALTLLEQHCVKCHGGEKTKAGLDLTTREALLIGGESGEAIVPGDPEKSLLYRMVTHDAEPGMPHKEEKLSAAAIHEIAEWLRAGAKYARTLDKKAGATQAKAGFEVSEADRRHWAFQPVVRPSPPNIAQATWGRNPIDRFILAELESHSLSPSSPAAKETLIRRLTIDLVGLPPTPAEIDAFVGDATPEAYPKLIDRLLASPHYGERWGRHWLDLARFAESDGFEHDTIRPHAWRYRDYVVRAFNTDKPYDRFVREQLAGDELYSNEPDALIATGFNLLGPDMVDSADQIQRRRNTLNDMTDTTALAFLGLTLGCARCHDHKFEPIAQRDYYSLQAFFAPARFRNDMPVPTAGELSAHSTATKAYNEQTKDLQSQLGELEAPYRQTILERKLAKLSPEAQTAHKTRKEERTTDQANLVLETEDQLALGPKELFGAMSKPDRAQQQKLLDQLKPYAKPTPLPASLALQNVTATKTYVLHRGDYNQPGDEVAAEFPQVLRGLPATSGQSAATHSSKGENPSATKFRAPLAQWIASAENPLTARVMVNRLWQHHFGRGLVATPSDFGTHGQKPTHPALLDWLASEFVASGWSVKAMHRLMLLSATYQQSSDGNKASKTGDPENRLWGRMNRLRLEGEIIRDSLLAISGDLNPALGGPGVFLPLPKELSSGIKGGWTASEDPRDHARRSIYIFARRNLGYPFLEVFDAPDSNLSCSSRERSTTAPQSLTLLNADEVLRAAELTAQRVTHKAATDAERVALAYRLILGRAPNDQEAHLSRTFLQTSPLNELCRALFNLNGFVYAE